MVSGYRTHTNWGNLSAENTRTVGQWSRSAQRAIVRRAAATAPKPKRIYRGSENLAGQHQGWVTKRGRYDWNVIVINRASYAYYVHEGTKGKVMRPGKFMVFPGSEVGATKRVIRTPRVRGQQSQPWLRDAFERVMRSRGVMNPIVTGPASYAPN